MRKSVPPSESHPLSVNVHGRSGSLQIDFGLSLAGARTFQVGIYEQPHT